MVDPVNEHVNQVILVGRLGGCAPEQTLPSGDLLIRFRVIVARPVRRSVRPAVDTVDCAAWTARTRRSLRGWDTGDLIEVTGALHRRFWRPGTGPTASRYEVEVSGLRRLRRATMAA
ncbi:MAG TPA: single-stranded DNA-binding protein [Candidatus Nanopelagicales bacterium]|jgi:single-strand DNA-binding protein|nr:single-stranded DNA-binding protein [Candidatus Nanopelagicales bacterium]